LIFQINQTNTTLRPETNTHQDGKSNKHCIKTRNQTTFYWDDEIKKTTQRKF
jgi:hypothetical protein